MQQVHPSKSYPDRKNIRLEGYDYSTHGCYFITAVLQDRRERFGSVTDGEVQLNAIGRMAEDTLHAVCHKHGVELQNYVVMPNHLHAIITLPSDDKVSLSTVMQHFKSETTWRYVNGVKQLGWPRFEKKLWQGRYYDHIIRSQVAYEKINEYILLNPQRWQTDELNINGDVNKDDFNAIIKQYEMFP